MLTNQQTLVTDIASPISIHNDVTTIYNLSGMKIWQGQTEKYQQVWQTLPRGIYIVNGNKEL